MSFDRDAFLEELYAETRSQHGIDLVMDTLSTLMDGLDWQQFDGIMQSYGGPRLFTDGKEKCNPAFEQINNLLRVVNPWKLPPSVGLSFLSMLWQNKEELSEYNAYKESFCHYLESIGKNSLSKDVKKRY